MSKIKVLHPSLRNKIAAGEVIERPASVVKELLENSIDAFSTNIEIQIIGAGKKLIRISDDGIGMDREDALLAFERYATSKIYTEEDLHNIKTLGFRGEALASIAAVSKVRLFTAPRVPPEDPASINHSGFCLELVGGELKEEKICSTLGTTIEVRDLFFNTPARRKFLKSDSTEIFHIIDVVTKEALSHYWIAFSLIIDSNKVMHLPKALSIRERLIQVYGIDFVNELFEISAQKEDCGFIAYLSSPHTFRSNRSNQFIFVNNRSVRDQTISQAIYKSYGELIHTNKHPNFFIFLTINPHKVDFNVHPTKREVRFKDKSEIFYFVQKSLETEIGKLTSISNFSGRTINLSKVTEDGTFMVEEELKIKELIAEQTKLYNPGNSGNIPCLYIGETFVVIPQSGGISIIDYHAAHERVIYERLLKREDSTSLMLLYPQSIKLDAVDYRVILENLQFLNDLGFDIHDFGYQTVCIRGIPSFLENTNLDLLLRDIATSLRYSSDIVDQTCSEEIDSKKRAIAAKIACHNSIRGKTTFDGKMVAILLKELSSTKFPDRCPHGRPTKIDISIDELKKLFKK
ncbi:MAG: DNA mismatch repair endonuclease MutL [Thermodesulfovibrionales bacterium]|nr:DNA mismatch repair endonuclease MutL [Thermodesulfovibrionales bacterium]